MAEKLMEKLLGPRIYMFCGGPKNMIYDHENDDGDLTMMMIYDDDYDHDYDDGDLTIVVKGSSPTMMMFFYPFWLLVNYGA